MGEWRTIDSAPRDGTTILVYGQPTDLVLDGNALVTYRRPLVASASWDSIDDCFVLTGGSWLGPFVMNPTHWLPLPSPPTDSGVT